MAKSRGTQPSIKHDPTALGRGFKRRLKSNDILLGGMVSEYLRPSLVKHYRYAGFDFIFVDKEHIFFDGLEMSDFVLCARDNQLPVISKIGELNRSETARLLEAGVVGIQLPRTESREDLMTLVEFVKFTPVGSRAAAPGFGNVDYVPPEDGAAWIKKANLSTVIVAHIETRKGYENAEEIVTTPHVDMVYVGPYDFSISMGHPGDYDHPDVKKGIQKILDLCLKHGVPFGTTTSGPKAAGQLIARGCRFFEVNDEFQWIREGARREVSEYRKYC